jgi:hypothetical protein
MCTVQICSTDIVSDHVTDVVMLSLKTCNMNCGRRWEGRGRVGSKGWAVDHQPGTSVDEYLHHDHQKGDFKVSKRGSLLYRGSGRKGEQGEDWIAERYS